MKAAALALLLMPLTGHADWTLVEAARERTQHQVRYDASYRAIDYPGGDVPQNIGVCTDLVVRAYRALEIDLQQRVHEDMTAHFERYPQSWGLTRPDRNIDHRRVPNLERFFERHGQSLAPSSQPQDYQPGDLVTWRLQSALPHIGIVSDRLVPGTERHQIIHNIGQGPREEDVLFAYPIHGHYRYHDDQRP